MKSLKNKIIALLLAAGIACALAPAAFAAAVQDAAAMALSVPATGDRARYAVIIAVVCGAAAVLIVAILLGTRKRSGK